MKILFVVKNIDTEHIGIMLLASILKQNKHKVEVIEANYRKICKKLKSDKCNILAYSCPTILLDFYLSLNKQLKHNFKIFSVFGGAHPTLVPEIIQEESIDCVCRGEGEYAFLELAEAMGKGLPTNNIRNLWVKDRNRLYKNALRPLTDDLDSLPFADRRLFPHNETFDKGKMHVLTSRGCNYSCTYCCHPAYRAIYNGQAKKVRRRSVSNVIEEIKQTMKIARIKFVMFEDDLFISSKDWIKEFCARYQKGIYLPFFCYARADLVSPAIIRDLKKAGCVGISMGLETANDYLRNYVLKRNMSRDDIINTARLIKREKIRLETTNIIGIPTSSLEDDIETLKLNVACRVDYSSVKLLMPYPKTEIREFSRKKGLLMGRYPADFWKSSIKFHDNKEKMARENLRKLFAVSVEFPFLLPIVKRIIFLPLGLLYTFIHLLWDGYVSFFRLYPTGLKGFWAGTKKYSNIFRKQLWT